MLFFLQFLILFQLTLESSHLTLECIECLFEATGKVYFNSYDGAPDIEIIDAFLVWLQTIKMKTKVRRLSHIIVISLCFLRFLHFNIHFIPLESRMYK